MNTFDEIVYTAAVFQSGHKHFEIMEPLTRLDTILLVLLVLVLIVLVYFVFQTLKRAFRKFVRHELEKINVEEASKASDNCEKV